MVIGRDILLRGRGADVGVRASHTLTNAIGAVVGTAIYLLGDALGLWQAAGLSNWGAQLGALLGGLLLASTGAGALLWAVAGVLTVTLSLVTFTPIVRPLIAPFVRADVASAAPVDAIAVLSGSITDDGRMTGQALDRLLTAMPLVQQRNVPELALSVVSRDDQSPPVTSEADQRALVQRMAPLATVRFVYNVHSTRDEALAFAALARTQGWKRVIVVTSPMHSARACRAVEVAGLLVECRPAESRDYSLRWLDRAANRRLAFQDVLYETAARLLYRSRSWM